MKKGFEIYQNGTHSFNFAQRLRILFGAKMRTFGVIIVDKECEVISGNCQGAVDQLIERKRKGGVCEALHA